MSRRFSLFAETRGNNKSDEPPRLAVTGSSHNFKNLCEGQGKTGGRSHTMSPRLEKPPRPKQNRFRARRSLRRGAMGRLEIEENLMLGQRSSSNLLDRLDGIDLPNSLRFRHRLHGVKRELLQRRINVIRDRRWIAPRYAADTRRQNAHRISVVNSKCE